MKKIVLCGGGTAGHVYPALAVAEKLQGYEIHFIGSCGIEKEIVKGEPNITLHEISAVKLQRKICIQNFLIPFKLIKAIREAKKILDEISPGIIFSKGGFVSVPVVLAASRKKIPIISHESDLTFGLANKLILRKCNLMCTTFERTGKDNKKCIHTGQPIREKILNGKKLDLKFDTSKPTLLVLGGSLGAKFLNDIVFENLDRLLENFNIIHLCGKKNFRTLKKDNYLLIPYADNIEDYYASSDIVISRAGSGVINELLFLYKPMLLIPLSKKASRGDQIDNAKYFYDLGYCEMLLEEEYNFDKFYEKLEKLLKNKQNFIKNMKKTAKNDAVLKICDLIENLTREKN